MIEAKCKHEWTLYVDVGTDSSKPSVYKCKKCAIIMTAPEVHQLEALENQNETLKHIKGFQKYIAVVAIIISFFALIISLYK